MSSNLTGAIDMTKKQRRQQGFTLIEIIAVIILLGVLAATVLPKFTDLTEEAKAASAKQAVAEGIARVNSNAASYILKSSEAPTNLANLGTLDTDGGDYVITYADGAAGEINVYAYSTGETDTTNNRVSGTAILPQ